MNFVFIVYHLVLSRKMGEKNQRGNARKVLLMVFSYGGAVVSIFSSLRHLDK